MWRRMGFWSVGPHSYTPSQFTFLLDANGHGQKPLDHIRIRRRVQGRLVVRNEPPPASTIGISS